MWSRRAKKRPQSEAFDEAAAAETQDRDDVQGSEASSAQDHDEDMYPEADVSTSADLDAFWSTDGSVDRFNLWAHTPLATYVADSPVAGLVNQFPSWAPWDQAAYSLALTGPAPPVDLVSSGQLTKEESQLTVWGLTYKVSVAALDALQDILSEVDGTGHPLFDNTSLQRTESQRRRVIDLNIPMHQRTAQGNLFTEDLCRAESMRNNTFMEYSSQ